MLVAITGTKVLLRVFVSTLGWVSPLFPSCCSVQADQGDVSSLLGHIGDSCYGSQQVVSHGHCWVDQGHRHWMAGCVCAWYCLLVIHPVGMENLPQHLQGLMHLCWMLLTHHHWTVAGVSIGCLGS